MHGRIRAGAGRFVTNKGIIDNIFPSGNSPFQPTVTVNNVSVDNPGAALNPTVEAYNFVNHPNLAAIGQTGGLNLIPTSSQFGEVRGKSTSNPRTLQVGLHYHF